MASTVMVSEARVLGEFLELVQVDSVSGEEGELAGILERHLSSLGFRTSNDGTGASTGNLIAWLPGTVSDRAPVAVNAHMDTVEPGHGVRPVVRDGVVRSSGDTILGADNKASIVAILEGVRAAIEADTPRPDLEIVLTYGEEVGLLGAKALDLSSLSSNLCFTLDAVAPIGTVVTAAPTQYSLRAAFHGRAAHAGAAPEEGIDALAAAARAIARMRLGRIDPETTANIGLMRAGAGVNVVPALAELRGEVRSHDEIKLEAQVDSMTAAMQEEAARGGAVLDLDITLEYRSYRLAPDSPPILAATRALQRLSVPPVLTATGASSDANILNEKGLPSVVLGTGMVAPHTVDERIAVSDLVLLSRLVYELITGS